MNTKKLGVVAAGGLLLLVGVVLIVVHLVSSPPEGRLDVTIDTKPTVMTVAYKAYGSAEAGDGQYWLSKAVMRNTGGQPLRNLEVSYRIPNYVDNWTTPDTAAELLPGQTAVLAVYPNFPPSVTRIRTRTPASIEIKFEYETGGRKISSIEKTSFDLRGITEIEFTSIPNAEIVSWHDMWANAPILAAYMTDEDEVVKAYFGKISETMGGTPYVQTVEDLAKLLRAIYHFQVSTGMVYMGAKGVPERLGEAETLVQSIKLPREVIRSNSATCIELTILLSALLHQCGVKSYMALVPGHAFTVIEGPDGKMYAFETTGIGGRNLDGIMTFEKAQEEGMKQWIQCMNGEMVHILVDYVAEHSKGIRPPELDPVDVTALMQMLTQRVKDRQTSRIQPNPNGPQPTPPDPVRPDPVTPDPVRPTVNMVPYTDPTGVLSLGIPEHWQTNPQAVQMMRQAGAPWLLHIAADPQTQWDVTTYGFGSPDHGACVQAVVQFVAALGAEMRVTQPQRSQLGGQQWTVVGFSFVNMGMQTTGQLYLHTVGQTTYGVSVGGPNMTQAQAQAMSQQILSTVRIRR